MRNGYVESVARRYAASLARTRGLNGLGDELENHLVVAARRLVATLDATELQVLNCLVRGMSVRQTAAMPGLDAQHIERARATMMQKLSARTTADAVRIGLYAGIDRSA